MSPPRQVFIAVVGAGGVGRCFFNQLAALTTRLSQSASSPIYLSLILVARSSKVLISDGYKPLNLSTWEEDLKSSDSPAKSPSEIADYLAKSPEKVVLVDNTSNQELADAYPDFLKKGINIVTPNKKAFSGSYSLWKDIFAAASNGGGSGGYVFHESSVGAGLP
ncbi:hypothetical protein LTS18_002542, partial [Coniosporium uncinatum]